MPLRHYKDVIDTASWLIAVFLLEDVCFMMKLDEDEDLIKIDAMTSSRRACDMLHETPCEGH